MAEHTFGDLIRERRSQLGLTQARVAELVGRSPSTVRSWERGRTIPGDHETLAAVAAVLGISDAELDPLFDDVAAGTPAEEPPPPPAGPVAAPPAEAAPRAAAPPPAAPAVEVALPGMEQPSEPIEAPPPPAAAAPEPEVGAPVVIELAGDELAAAEAPPGAAEQMPEVSGPPALELVQEQLGPVETPAAPPTEMEEVPPEVAPPPAEQEVPQRAEPTPPPAPLLPGGLGTAPSASPPGLAVQGETPWPETPRGAWEAPRSYFEDPVEQSTYRIRLALTAAAGVLLLIVFVWALGELGEALSGVLQQLRRGG